MTGNDCPLKLICTDYAPFLRAIKTSSKRPGTRIYTLDTTRYVFVFTKKNLQDRRRTCFALFSTTLYITK